MRNLKRALSLALASIMLLGMMVVGASAKSTSSFPDADKISNAEAVDLTSGLGIFKGYEDGQFKPENIVTRAEMAVMICKILHGADVDPANFAGAGKFTDVPAWAEGYVNLCSSLHIIEGYGNGKFGPNDPVTTVQASTMLLKALGYYTEKENALGADWQLEVTSKATALGLYGDLTLAMNAGLTRDNAAELLYNTLFAQRVAFDNNRILYVKANDRSVVVTNGTNDPMNTLAQNTFGLYVVEGLVTANGMTTERLSKSLKSEGMTRVQFDAATDLNHDGKFEVAENGHYDFEAETGLDMIGHAAKVYYKVVKGSPVVFAITDQATLVKAVDFTTNTTRLADRANDAGFKKNTVLDTNAGKYVVNFDYNTLAEKVAGYQTSSKFDASKLEGKTLILISNSGNYNVDEIIVLDQYIDRLTAVEEDRNGNPEYTMSLTKSNQGNLTIALNQVKEKDLVIVTKIGLKDDVTVFEAANVVTADITKLTGISDGASSIKRVTAGGQDYTESNVVVDGQGTPFKADVDEIVRFRDIATIGSANLVLDRFGKLIGLSQKAVAPNYAYVAQYGVRRTTTGLNTYDVLTAHVYFADGTNGIYEVDAKNSNQITFPVAKFHEQSTITPGNVTALNAGNWNSSTINDAQSLMNNAKNTNGLGIWDVDVKSNNTITINSLDNGKTTRLIPAAAKEKVAIIPGHSTLLKDLDKGIASANNVTTSFFKNATLYNNNDTIYFYVNGVYGKDNFSVNVVTGIKNVIKHSNKLANTAPATTRDTGITQTFASQVGNMALVDTMLIQDVKVAAAQDMYYYNEGNYYVVKDADKGFTVTYKVYDAKTGEVKEITYNNDGKYFESEAKAKKHAENLVDGFYIQGNDNLEVKVADKKVAGTNYFDHKTGTADASFGKHGVDKKIGDNIYVVNAFTSYDEVAKNLFDNVTGVGSITEAAKVVDVCNSKLDSIAKIVKAVKNDGSVLVSYSFDKNFKTPVLFVTHYKEDSTQGPGVVTNYTATAVVDRDAGTNQLKITPTVATTDGTNFAAGQTLKVNYTVYLKDGSNWMKLGTYAGTDITTAAANSVAGTADTISSITAANNATYKVEVTIAGGSVLAEGIAYGMF